jgi:hypothetical protein
MDLLTHTKTNVSSYLLNVENLNIHVLPPTMTLKLCSSVVHYGFICPSLV